MSSLSTFRPSLPCCCRSRPRRPRTEPPRRWTRSRCAGRCHAADPSRSKDHCVSASAPGCVRSMRTPTEADAIGGRVFVTSGGRYYVPTAAARNRILEARNRSGDSPPAWRVPPPSTTPPSCTPRCTGNRRQVISTSRTCSGRRRPSSLLKAAGEAPEVALETALPGAGRQRRCDRGARRRRSPSGSSIAGCAARCTSRRASSPSGCEPTSSRRRSRKLREPSRSEGHGLAGEGERRQGRPAHSVAELLGQHALIEAVVGVEHHEQLDVARLFDLHAR